jgi:hypothetical protein
MALEDEFDPSVERLRKSRSDNSRYESWIKWLAKQEGKSEEAFVKNVLKETAEKVLEKKREQWMRAAAKKAKIMSDCAKDHCSPPENYWQEEHKALQFYQQAEGFLEAVLKEV